MTQFTKAEVVRRSVKDPSDMEVALCLSYLEENYRLPSLSGEWFSFDVYVACLSDLDFTSTPGIPYMREAPTIGQWLGWDGLGGYNQVQVLRLWHDVQLCLAGRWEHRFRAFVKEEPHKKAKIAQQRWRLILCAALPMQMLWRMAVKHQNDWLNDHPYECPSAHGLVFCYGGWRRFRAVCKAKGLEYSRDISSWDVNAPGWVFRVVKEFRQRAGGPESWLRCLDLLYRDAFAESVIRFSNGVVVKQCYEGTMKSGLFVTIADNSLAMVAMHFLASLRSGQRVGSVWATGDDVLQSHISDSYVDELEGLGCRVKEVERKLVFMGTDFSGVGPEPVYLSKHVVNFWVSEDFVEDKLDAYARLWCHSRWYHFWRALASSSAVTLRSQSYYRFWYDNPIARILDLI